MQSATPLAPISGSGVVKKTQKPTTELNRKTQSCFDCRRRKLRCDREYPSCGRCRKSGQQDSCSYAKRLSPSKLTESIAPQTPGKSIAVPLAIPDWSSSNPRVQVGQIDPKGYELSIAKRKQVLESRASEAIEVQGESFRRQYYGNSSPTSTITHFPELRDFMKETVMQHTSLSLVRRELKALQVRWKNARASIIPMTDRELLYLLPDRETTDHLVSLYFDTFETMYRIIHRPSFLKEYEMFWRNQSTASPAFIVLLLLTVATVSCISLQGQPTYIGKSTISREHAVLWIEVAEWWLGCQSQKKLYLAIWQVRCLLILAKHVNVVKKKQAWIGAGNLVREAVSAGFHRDPSLYKEKMSVFEQEMRRRLWATMVELELQASIDRGMPSASIGIVSDCMTVTNVNDKDLTVDCDSLPVSRLPQEYTTCSFLHISKSSFSLRVTLTSLVNDFSSCLLYSEALKYEDLLQKELEKLPLRVDSRTEQRGEGFPEMVRTLLDVQLRQFLLLLHAPFSRQPESNSRCLLSMMICFDTAVNILDQHWQLSKSSNFLLLLLRHDHMRAALVICHNTYISTSIQNSIFNSHGNTIIPYVEKALVMIGNKIARLGTSHLHYWYISAACALINSKISPQETSAQKLYLIDRVTKQYYCVLASQEDFLKAKNMVIPIQFNNMNTVDNQLQTSSDASGIFDLSFPDPGLEQRSFEQAGTRLADIFYSDPAAWTFDWS